jgi:hypothetical protein
MRPGEIETETGSAPSTTPQQWFDWEQQDRRYLGSGRGVIHRQLSPNERYYRDHLITLHYCIYTYHGMHADA